MPPDRGRASKACEACHKQKTRCYPPESGGVGCLRCARLHLSCSLGAMQADVLDSTSSINRQEERIKYLEKTVHRLVEQMGNLDETWFKVHPQTDHVDASSTELRTPAATSQTQPILSPPPVFMIRDVANELGVGGHHDRNITPSYGQTHCIVTQGLLTNDEATSLILLFQEHCGHWIRLSELLVPGSDLLTEVRKMPLLLCTVCLIAIRHTEVDSASRLAPQLFQEAKDLISSALLVVPQTIEFFQAALILSLWSTTIGQVLLSIDSWLLSGYAIQQSLAGNVFSFMNNRRVSTPLTSRDYNLLCLWNHLCLVHLHYCIGTRRKAMLDRTQIDKCRLVSNSEDASNFEHRMVAEVDLYWIIYESCSFNRVDLPRSQEVLYSWKQEWGYLLDQPRSQFLQMGFHFAQLILYDQCLKSRSAAVRESLLSEMVRVSAAIIRLAMETSDIRTQHLSDHIYHIITFAAISLCRLLHMYEQNLAVSHDISELDRLVLALVAWLNSIGLPNHIAQTLAEVVSAFHTKLRGDATPAPRQDPDPWSQTGFPLFYPESFGLESFDGGLNFVPDWDPDVQGSLS